MDWINVNKEKPETHSQHNEVFLSDEVGIWGWEGFSSDKYFRKYDLKNGTGKLLEEGWVNELDVTHWLKIIPPSDGV